MDFGFTSKIPYFIAIAAAVLAFMYAVAIVRLMGMRLQRPRVRLKKQQDMPDYLLKLFDRASIRLAALGFEDHHYQESQNLIAHQLADKLTKVMVNHDTGVYAEISPASTFLDLPGYEVDLWSFTNDAGALMTVNGRAHTMLDEIPGAVVHDSMVGSLEEQYQAHMEEQKTFSGDKVFVITNSAGYIKIQQKLLDGHFIKLMKDKSIVSTGSNRFRISFSKSLKLVNQFTYGEREIQKLMKDKIAREAANAENYIGKANDEDNNTYTSTDTYDLETEVQAYLRASSVPEQKNIKNNVIKLIVFSATVLLTYLSFDIRFDYASVAIVAGVLLLHDLGQILAMHLFKYRDLKVLFIPWPAAASGTGSENISAWRQVVVYLAGPLPGIIIGILLIAINSSLDINWIYEASILLLLFNYLSLLPVMPLDGGQVVRLTVMERYSRGKLYFLIFSALMLVATALFLGEPVFWMLALLLAFTLPSSFREIGLLKELHAIFDKFEYLDQQSKIAQMFKILRKPKFKKYIFVQKYTLVKNLSAILLQPRHASKSSAMGFAGLYLCALLLTPPAALFAYIGIGSITNAMMMVSGEYSMSNWNNRIAKVEDPEQRFSIILDAARFYTTNNSPAAAIRYLNRAEKYFALINRDESLARLYQAYAYYFRQTEEWQNAEDALNKIFILYEDIENKDYHLLASVAQTLATIKFQQSHYEEFEPQLLNALDYASKITQPEQRFIIASLVGQLLDYYYKANKLSTAEKLLQTLLPKLEKYNDPNGMYVTGFVHQELAWLHAKNKNYDAAIKQLDIAMELNERNYRENGLESTGVMANINIMLAKAAFLSTKGDIREAANYFQQAENIIKDGYFKSMDDYIGSYSEEYFESLGYLQSRETERWEYIAGIYSKL